MILTDREAFWAVVFGIGVLALVVWLVWQLRGRNWRTSVQASERRWCSQTLFGSSCASVQKKS